MGAGDKDLGTLGGVADLHHIHLQALTLYIVLALHLLVGAQIGVGELGAGVDAQSDGAVAGVDAGDDAGEQLVLLVAELVIDHALLGLADALDDDLAGGLGGHAAKVLGLDLHADHVAQLGLGQDQAGLLQADLGGGIVYLLHDVLLQKQADGAGVGVGVNDQIIAHALVVPAIGGQQSLGDLLHHITGLDALLLLDLGDGGKKLLAVQFVAVCGFCRSLSHSVFLLKYQKRGYSRTSAISFFSKMAGSPPTSRVTSPSCQDRSAPTKSFRPSRGR